MPPRRKDYRGRRAVGRWTTRFFVTFSPTPIVSHYSCTAVECCCTAFAYGVRRFRPSAWAVSAITIIVVTRLGGACRCAERRSLGRKLSNYCSADPALGSRQNARRARHCRLPISAAPGVAREDCGTGTPRGGAVDAYWMGWLRRRSRGRSRTAFGSNTRTHHRTVVSVAVSGTVQILLCNATRYYPCTVSHTPAIYRSNIYIRTQ